MSRSGRFSGSPISQPADLVLRGGTVFTPQGPRHADVAIAGGRIISVGDGVPAATEQVDAAGLWVLPGAIDAHVHSRDPGFPEKEDFGSLTAAASAGGVTTVVDMPNTVPAVDSAAVFEDKVEIASAKAHVDFALWGVVRSTWTPEDVHGLLDAGAVGLKAYLGYAVRRSNGQVVYTLETGNPDLEKPPDYGTLARVAPLLARRGAALAAHCEDPSVLREFARPLRSYADVLDSRPALAEAIAVDAMVEISRSTGVDVHVVHLSSAAGLEAVRRGGGARLTVETCPQYLWFCDDDSERLGGVLKMYPPVRTAADRAALLQGLSEGLIQRVATDHAPHTDGEKLERPLEETAAGSPGVETLYLSCLELARRRGNPARAVEWVCQAPARALRLHPRKGSISVGADADLVLVDPNRETVVSRIEFCARANFLQLGNKTSFDFGYYGDCVYFSTPSLCGLVCSERTSIGLVNFNCDDVSSILGYWETAK